MEAATARYFAGKSFLKSALHVSPLSNRATMPICIELQKTSISKASPQTHASSICQLSSESVIHIESKNKSTAHRDDSQSFESARGHF